MQTKNVSSSKILHQVESAHKLQFVMIKKKKKKLLTNDWKSH